MAVAVTNPPLGLVEPLWAIGAGDERIVGLYLFGSQAHGDARPDSDVDVGVLFEGEVPVEELLELEDAMERVVGKAVQLVDVARARPFLALDIIRGERIYAADEYRCDQFDLYVLRRAGDLEPFERERRRLVLTPTSDRSLPR
jgi:predicted nucleotidyltransferase